MMKSRLTSFSIRSSVCPVCFTSSWLMAARMRRISRAWMSMSVARSEEHTSELQSQTNLVLSLFFLMIRRPPRSTLFPYTTSSDLSGVLHQQLVDGRPHAQDLPGVDVDVGG